MSGTVGVLSIRQPANPRARQPPQQEASPQDPEEPEEILGSDDEEQEDPNDYCKGLIVFMHTYNAVINDNKAVIVNNPA